MVQEFLEGWDKLVEAFLENSADGLGLSRIQIVIAVAYLLTFLSLLIVFVLITLAAWNNDSSFTATVQAALVSGCGKAATSLRKRGAAEAAENTDGIVGKIMQDQGAEDEG